MISVILSDEGIDYDQVYQHYAAADTWARKHCASYHTYQTVDVSDVSLCNDVTAQYWFGSEQDVTVFKLKWL